MSDETFQQKLEKGIAGLQEQVSAAEKERDEARAARDSEDFDSGSDEGRAVHKKHDDAIARLATLNVQLSGERQRLASFNKWEQSRISEMADMHKRNRDAAKADGKVKVWEKQADYNEVSSRLTEEVVAEHYPNGIPESKLSEFAGKLSAALDRHYSDAPPAPGEDKGKGKDKPKGEVDPPPQEHGEPPAAPGSSGKTKTEEAAEKLIPKSMRQFFDNNTSERPPVEGDTDFEDRVEGMIKLGVNDPGAHVEGAEVPDDQKGFAVT